MVRAVCFPVILAVLIPEISPLKKLLDITAHIISLVFNPFLLPVMGLALVFQTNSLFRYLIAPPVQKLILATVFFFYCFMPLVTIVLFKRYRMVNAYHLPSGNERRLPLLMSCLYFGMAYFSIQYLADALNLISHLKLLMLAGLVVGIVATLINLWYKISIHMLSIGSLLGLFTAFAHLNNPFNQQVLIGLIVLGGMIGFARLQLKAHTPGQVALGYVVGFFVEYGVITLF